MGKKLWFKQKTHGFGWVPIVWQGWALIGAYVGLCILVGVLLLPHSGEELGVVYITAFGLLFISLTSFLIGIGYYKGPSPTWQWGNKNKSKKENDESR